MTDQIQCGATAERKAYKEKPNTPITTKGGTTSNLTMNKISVWNKPSTDNNSQGTVEQNFSLYQNKTKTIGELKRWNMAYQCLVGQKSLTFKGLFSSTKDRVLVAFFQSTQEFNRKFTQKRPAIMRAWLLQCRKSESVSLISNFPNYLTLIHFQSVQGSMEENLEGESF